MSRGFSPYGLFSIYNGLDFNIAPRELDRSTFLESLGLKVSKDDVVCGIAARLDPVKDIPTLLRAFADTPDHMKLVVAGDESKRRSSFRLQKTSASQIAFALPVG